MNHWRTSDFYYQIAAVLGGEWAKSDGEGAGGVVVKISSGIATEPKFFIIPRFDCI